MKKVFAQIKKYWKINLITFVISLLVGSGIFCLYFFLRGQTLLAAVDGVTLGGLIVLFLGLLMLVNHLGAFDTFAFGFKQLGSMIFAKDPRKDHNYQEYKEGKNIKRKDSSYNFVVTIFAGLLFVIAIIVLEIIYKVGM